MSTNGTAPVCPISRNQATPGMPGIRIPIPPKAVDLPSAITVVNTIKNILTQLIVAQRPVVNNVFPPNMPAGGPGGSSPTQHGGGSTLRRPRWREVGRQTVKLKFYNPDDEEQWIEVERIVQIRWHDSAYNTDLTFTYGDDGARPGAKNVVDGANVSGLAPFG